MKGVRSLLAASWLLILCAAANASASATTSAAVIAPGAPLTLAELESAAFPELRALAASSHDALEELAARRLSAMTAAATVNDDATLRTQAQAIFNLYRKVDPALVATWGTSVAAQLETFYNKIFPKVVAKAQAKRAAAKANATVVSTTKNPDGSTTVTKSDGSVTTTQADGTIITTDTDGSKTTVKTDGTKVVVAGDGTTTTTNADGTKVVTSKDGSTTTTTKTDGSTVTTKTDGTTVTTKADGSSVTTTSDGTVVTVGTDGTSTTTKSDGSTTVVKPDGTTTVTKPDGTVTVTTPAPGTSVTRAPGVTTPPGTTAPGTSTGGLTVKSTTPSYEVADSLAFLSEIYDENLASNVRALRDNTGNIETIVQSSKGSDTDVANQYQAPTVLESNDSPTVLGRRLATNQATKVDVLFCDISGNAIWKWSASDASTPSPGTNTSTSTTSYVLNPDLCTAKEVTVTVNAYQSGCSRQNHPEGCENVYYKGCGGLTVSPGSNQIVVARTGGRSLGMLSYKQVGSTCQGRVVDAIRTFRGKKFNSPSYAEYSQKGHLYFTDSPFGLAKDASDFEGDTLDKSPLREIPFNGVYFLKNGENGSEPVQLIDCFMDRPNKIAFSPKEDVMYVTNSRKGNTYVKQFNIKDDGSVGNSSVLFNFTAFPELKIDEGYADGIKVDEDGFIYVAVQKGVYVLSPAGTLIGVVQSTQALSALAFGGGRMFVTGSFGVVAQASSVFPAVPPPKAKTTC